MYSSRGSALEKLDFFVIRVINLRKFEFKREQCFTDLSQIVQSTHFSIF